MTTKPNMPLKLRQSSVEELKVASVPRIIELYDDMIVAATSTTKMGSRARASFKQLLEEFYGDFKRIAVILCRMNETWTFQTDLLGERAKPFMNKAEGQENDSSSNKSNTNAPRRKAVPYDQQEPSRLGNARNRNFSMLSQMITTASAMKNIDREMASLPKSTSASLTAVDAALNKSAAPVSGSSVPQCGSGGNATPSPILVTPLVTPDPSMATPTPQVNLLTLSEQFESLRKLLESAVHASSAPAALVPPVAPVAPAAPTPPAPLAPSSPAAQKAYSKSNPAVELKKRPSTTTFAELEFVAASSCHPLTYPTGAIGSSIRWHFPTKNKLVIFAMTDKLTQCTLEAIASFGSSLQLRYTSSIPHHFPGLFEKADSEIQTAAKFVALRQAGPHIQDVELVSPWSIASVAALEPTSTLEGLVWTWSLEVMGN